jgi:hypothetical protein
LTAKDLTIMQGARPVATSLMHRLPWHCLALLTTLGLLGCATLVGESGQPLVPTRFQTRTGPFAIYTSTPITPDASAIRCLGQLERDVKETLGLSVPDDVPPVEVYVLKDREAFSHFLKFYYPELPPRRAFFLAQGPRRVVYAFLNDRLDEDLRHEATHALLHATVGDLPLWLDEGLAEYFEGPEGSNGLNPEHIARLPDDLKSGWRPDLARLESLATVREMSPRDYREAWAWVHYLLGGPPPCKSTLLTYLTDIHANLAATKLSERLAKLEPGSDERMLAHLEHVRTAAVVSTSTPAKSKPGDRTLLLQNASIEPPPRAPARRGLFSRFLGWIGLGGGS